MKMLLYKFFRLFVDWFLKVLTAITGYCLSLAFENLLTVPLGGVFDVTMLLLYNHELGKV